MKKNFKKLISGAMALVMAAGLMAGCGGNGGSADNYQIDWYLVTGAVPGDTSEVEAKVDEYLAEKLPGTTLKMHYLDWGSYTQKLNVMMAGGEKFDICYTAGDSYRQNVAKNAFVPLNDLIDEFAPKTKEIIGEDFLKGSQINGVNYGIPANKDKGHQQGVIYRKDLAKELGLEEMLANAKTLDDMYPIYDIVKEKRPDIIPLKEGASQSTPMFINFDTVAFPIGFMLDDETLTPVNYIETEEYKEAVLRVRQNRLDGYTKADYKESSEMHFAEFAGLKPGKAAELTVNRQHEYGQIELTDAYMTNSDATGSIMAVSRTSGDPERVVKFLELFNTDPYLNNLIIYGIEGKHYNKIDENYVEPIKDSGYGNAGMQWEFGNTFINYLTKGEDVNKVKNMEEFNDNLKQAPSLGFVFDGAAVKTETGACLNVQAEFENTLHGGSDKDPEKTLEEYRAKMKAAGVDKVLAEVTRQLNEWKKANGK
ncbi:MAG: ABC transporter substrate-binding protein [Clostridiales bacterium]|nr:ABC transporter substrate-binding protein [Clostridiales bacterium]